MTTADVEKTTYEWIAADIKTPVRIQVGPINAVLMSFEKDGHRGNFDIVDGKFDYRGDLPVTEAAEMLFDCLVPHIDALWLERAATKEKVAS